MGNLHQVTVFKFRIEEQACTAFKQMIKCFILCFAKGAQKAVTILFLKVFFNIKYSEPRLENNPGNFRVHIRGKNQAHDNVLGRKVVEKNGFIVDSIYIN